ncbi:MAG TPA: hypothetical protein VN667_17940 [Burkholderiales bacterium]|nr:hypothetical protein [Burkholderiales bacterium]
MSNREFRTDITADGAQYDATMEAAAVKAMTTAQVIQSSMREASVGMIAAMDQVKSQVQTSFDGIKGIFDQLKGSMLAVTGAMAGGAMLGKFVSDSAKATSETQLLARMLGTTTQEATALRIALGDIGLTAEDYTGMVGKMTMKLREGEERFNELGVKTRGANGELLNTEQITANTISTLEKFKAGTDRNLASTEFFGRGWAEVMKLMKLTPALMEEARAKAEALQMTVGPEGAQRAKEYKLAVNDVKDVMEAIANRVGQAVMPVLTDLGNWLKDVGPVAVQIMRIALADLMSAFYALQVAVRVVYEFIVGTFRMVGEAIRAPLEAAWMAIHGDLKGAAERMKEVGENWNEIWGRAFKKTEQSAQESATRIKQLWSFDAEQGASRSMEKGGKSYTPKADKDKSQMSSFETELARQRDAYERMKLDQGSFETYTLAMESAYWKKILDNADLSVKDREAVLRKYYEAERGLRKQAFEAEIEDYKARIEANRKGSVERIQIAGEEAAKVKEKFGEQSKEYRAALAQMSQLARERAEEQKKLAELQLEAERNEKLGEIALERDHLDALEKLGIIKSQDKIARLKALAEQEYQIRLEELQAEWELAAEDEVQQAKALERIAELRRKHSLDMQKLDEQSAEATKKSLDQWIDPITSGIQTMTNGMLQGTQKLSQIMANFWRNLAAQGISTLLKMGAEWIKTEILKTQATTAGVAARTAAETTGSTQSMLTMAGEAIKNIGAKAWEAAASVYASIASIPYVGPFLAPAMAAAAAAAVLGFAGNIMHAEGGFNVPSGMNPVTQLHQEEMVLPRDIANPLRQQLAAGNGVGGGGTHLHFHGPVWDHEKFGRYVVQQVKAQKRNFFNG